MAKDGTKVMYTTSMDKDVIKAFKVYCAMKDKYQNEVLEDILREFLIREGVRIGDSDK